VPEKRTNASWVRALMEGAVIVGSILLAFLIQAWWDESRDRAEERQALGALASEFRDALVLLERQSLLTDSIVAAVEIIHEWTGPSADPRHADSLAVLLPTVTRLPGFAPPSGTLDALLGSGDLRLIENDSLRAALASFPSQLAGMNKTESFGSDALFGDFFPYLNETVPMRIFGQGGDGDSRFPADATDLLRSREFENQLQLRLTNMLFLRRGMDAMKELLSKITSMLEAELSR